MNKSSAANSNAVLDFVDTDDVTNATDSAAENFAVPGTALTLSIDGDQGVLLAAEADLDLSLFGLVSASGHFSFQKATGNFVLTDGATHISSVLSNAGYLAIAGHLNSASIGAGAVGLTLNDVDLAILLVTNNVKQASRTSDRTAFFLFGEVVELQKTSVLFTTPSDQRTADYISGRFG